MKTLTFKIDRLYNGFLLDLRSYQWQKAKDEKANVRVLVKNTGRWITIKNKDLDEGEWGTKLFKSKQRRGKDYYLVSFSVRSDKVKEEERKVKEEPVQLSAFEAMAESPNINKHLEAMRRIFK